MKSWLQRHWPTIALHVIVLGSALGVMAQPQNWGREDWDYFAHHYEALRRSTLEFHQFPWWDPWASGGLPLAANPQLGLVSIDFFLVLLFGTYLGLRLSVLIHLLLAAEGARWLAGHWYRDRLACAVVGLIFALNGAVALAYAAGHIVIVQFVAWLPWALVFAFRLERDPRWGFALGGVLALAVLGVLHYYAVYSALVLAGVITWRFLAVAPGKEHASNVCLSARRRLVLGCLCAGATFFLAAGFRTALTLELVLDFPMARFSQILQSIGPWDFVGTLFLPGQGMEFRPVGSIGGAGVGWHEYGCYVGVCPCLLFLVSLRRGWHWWHSLAVAGFWLALGNSRWFHPSWWLTYVPILSSIRVATRWRIVGVLGTALGSGAVLSDWATSDRRGFRISAIGVAAWIALDLGLNSFPVYRETFVIVPAVIERPDADRDFVQLHNNPLPERANSAMFATIQANYGVVYGYEPLIGQDSQSRSSRLWRDHPEYRGEYWSDAGPVRVIRWSPNAISLQAPPNAVVHVNQNPGSYWMLNGRRIFQNMRSVDRHAEFSVEADGAGQVDLTVRPRSVFWGAILSAVGLAGVVLLGNLVNQKLQNRQASNQQRVPS